MTSLPRLQKLLIRVFASNKLQLECNLSFPWGTSVTLSPKECERETRVRRKTWKLASFCHLENVKVAAWQRTLVKEDI